MAAIASKDRSKPKKEEKKKKKDKVAPKKDAPKKASSSANGVHRGRPSNVEKVRRAATLLKQLADPTRLQMLMALRTGGKHVGAICSLLGQSQPAVSHHLAILRHALLVIPTRNGKQVVYDLSDTGEALVEIAVAVMG